MIELHFKLILFDFLFLGTLSYVGLNTEESKESLEIRFNQVKEKCLKLGNLDTYFFLINFT